MQQKNNFGLMLGLSIAEMLCCFQITGIIGIVLSILANTAYKNGDYEDYASKAKITKIVLIVGLVLGLLANILVFVLYGSAIMAELSYY